MTAIGRLWWWGTLWQPAEKTAPRSCISGSPGTFCWCRRQSARHTPHPGSATHSECPTLQPVHTHTHTRCVSNSQTNLLRACYTGSNHCCVGISANKYTVGRKVRCVKACSIWSSSWSCSCHAGIWGSSIQLHLMLTLA